LSRAFGSLLVVFLAVSILFPFVNAQAQTKELYEGPMIDAHANAVDWSADWMIRTMEAYHTAGVDKVIFADGDGALEAHNSRPNEIIPSFYIYYMNRTGTIKDLKSALDRGFMWIGEALLRHWGETNTSADDPVALQIFDLCAKYRVPITIHQDSGVIGAAAYTELERALDHSPDCTVAFHGWWLRDLGISGLERLILAHPNLYVELAGELEQSAPPWTRQTFLGGTDRDIFAYSNGQIREEWRDIFEKYPSRFINGFDFFSPGAYTFESIRTRVQYWRNLLGQLSQDTAERIAYKNVEDLLQHRTPSEVSIEVRVSDCPYTITVSGRIQPAIPDTSITVYYIDPTGTRLSHEVKARNGAFEDSNAPSLTGYWLVQAAWNGTAELLGRESAIVRARVLTGGIIIDGYEDDWKPLQLDPLVSDPRGDNVGGVSGTDIKAVYAAPDEKYLYLMFEVYGKIDPQVRVQYCFGIDINGDGKWEYQPGFDVYGNAWIWNLTGGRDYSDQRNVSPLEGAETAAQDVIEFKMPLAAIDSPQRMMLAPYFVIEQAGKYVTADNTARFEVSRPKNDLLPGALATTSVTQTCVATVTWGTVTEITTSGSQSLTTIVPTTVETTTTAERETTRTTSVELAPKVFTTEALVIVGLAFIVLVVVGVFYLRRRRK